MNNIRVFYEKKENARYTSHLDMNRLMQRALKRSKLDVWYTEGYNPHMYISFALPLPLGYESECEVMDFRLNNSLDFEEIKNILNRNMPNGIYVKRAANQIMKPSAIASADYEVKIYSKNAENLLVSFDEFIKRAEINVLKTTKKGTNNINIKEHILKYSFQLQENLLIFSVTLPAGVNKNYNPSLIMDKFKSENMDNITKLLILKKQIYSNDDEIFE